MSVLSPPISGLYILRNTLLKENVFWLGEVNSQGAANF